MCTICGCGDGESGLPEHAHAEHSQSEHHLAGQARATHFHEHESERTRQVQVEQDILARNNAFANSNRRYFTERGLLAVNLLSSPGSGKTSLLVTTIRDLGGEINISVIEGDQQTARDAQRIREAGATAFQINTGKGCHLDAHMVGHALEAMTPPAQSVLLIENVGNLVCPALFDLGEAYKVVVLSVTEGDDKPLKYPDMFSAADLVLINKIDLLPYVAFDVDACIEYARRVKPGVKVVRISATTSEGMQDWYRWLRSAWQLNQVGN